MSIWGWGSPKLPPHWQKVKNCRDEINKQTRLANGKIDLLKAKSKQFKDLTRKFNNAVKAHKDATKAHNNAARALKNNRDPSKHDSIVRAIRQSKAQYDATRRAAETLKSQLERLSRDIKTLHREINSLTNAIKKLNKDLGHHISSAKSNDGGKGFDQAKRGWEAAVALSHISGRPIGSDTPGFAPGFLDTG